MTWYQKLKPSGYALTFAEVALSHIQREYPNKLDHILLGDDDLRSPRSLHPIFYGSFDWHSCVHGYWLLARLLRRYPELPQAPLIIALFDEKFTAENVEAEREYAAHPSRKGFERPYGWAWLLMLAGELSQHDTEHGRRWYEMLQPLADVFEQRFLEFLPKATYPIRVGTHFNTAFALTLALDYAHATEAVELAELCRATAKRWYLNDRDCQAWEPGGDDFLSSALIECECMRRVLGRDFGSWLQGFLPRLAQSEPASLFEPAIVSDRTDGKIAHLDGLNLSRAWCWRGIASALPEAEPLRDLAMQTASTHLDASLPHVTGDYMGEHWLATFALLALEA
jgi:hypothetical protein